MPSENRRVQYTKNALRCALLALLSEKPIKNVTVTDVCARADVNRSTFYLHYKDVYDLLGQMENDLITEMVTSFDVSPERSAQDHITDMLRVVAKHHALCLAILSEHGNPQFVRRLGQQSRAGFLSHWHALLPQASERLLVLIYAFTMNGASAVVEQWLLGDCAEPPAHIAQLLTVFADSCLHGCEALLQ